MAKKLKPLVPRAMHSRMGTVIVLRVPVGTDPEKAEEAKYQARLMADRESGIKRKRFDYIKSKGQMGLF